MVQKIIWSPNAGADNRKINRYLISEWNEYIAERYLDTVDRSIERLLRFPESGMKSVQQDNVRSVLLSKHNRLYYRLLAADTIEIASVFGLKQDPAKNPYG